MDTLRATGDDQVMFSVDYPFEDDVEIGGWLDRLELNGNTRRLGIRREEFIEVGLVRGFGGESGRERSC
jgi:hypothetical protein